MPSPTSKNLLTDNRRCGISCAMSSRLLVLALVAALPVLAGAADVPLPGKRLVLKDTPRRQSASIDFVSTALAAPFPDPTTGASLIISGGAGVGQCRVEIPLDPSAWQPIAGDGPGRG